MLFRIDLKIFAFLILFYFTRQIEIYATILIFCIIHELGHLLAGLILKMKPKKIEIMPLGISISFYLQTKDYNKKILKANVLELKKILVAIAGPITNIILIILYTYFNPHFITKEIAIYSNILILIFNLIPIYPLDGGRILKGIIHIFYGGKYAKIITNKVANILIIILTVVGSIAIFYFENIAILLIILFLWILVIQENKRYKLLIKAYEM